MGKTLEHFGVKGMRWGVRRKGRSGRSSDHTSTRKLLKGKKLSSMSNDDIKKVNQRLGLERNFKKIDPTAKAAGKRAVGTFLGTYGSAVIGGVAGGAATATVGRIIKKAGG